ncbi:MAG: glycyl-radical enzyme activating protein, partial [Treponema sp.]|nr:glycyl-radical enzyme activating protein [Treponema sp.]
MFNIQKFSIHDGPGIRTVVFFKGCPLRCGWCANPESRSTRVQLLWDPGKCRRCLRCVRVCPRGALEDAGGRIRVDRDRCGPCDSGGSWGICAAACPGQALSLAGKLYSPREVLDICLQDRAFYEESGGGVTLSGGEVLAQEGFAGALLKLLGQAGIHRAIETSGFAAPEVFIRITDLADLLLFDIKHHHRERHFEGTGVYNDRIIANLETALRRGRKLLPRIPVIPGYNNSPEDAAAFADLLRSAWALQPGSRPEVQLLPFHQFGRNKYTLLGLDYGMEKTKALYQEDLEPYRAV